MKRIGLLGGMSWESSAEYYRIINELVRDRLGGLHSADCVLRSVDFAEIEQLQRTGAWEQAAERLAREATGLLDGGAELLVLCTNTMHKVADAVSDAVAIPLVHIADATAEAVRSHGLSRVGLLATAYTMEQDFYVGRLRDLHGLDVLVPDEPDRRIVHGVIYDELCLGVVRERSRDEYRRIMRRLHEMGAEAILFGCTEIDLLVGPDDSPVPVFDTTRLHAERAVELALETAPGGGLAERPDPPFQTRQLPQERDVVAPDGSDVRVLLGVSGGSLAHFELAGGETSIAVRHRSVEEVWYFLRGKGEMWRKSGDGEEVVPVARAVCVTIPLGTSFQFRASGDEPLSAIGATIPPWPGPGEALIVSGPWEPTVQPGSSE
ncbi:MAG TPA: amino acid racemase [Solirubrobacteraceae bacterium]|nr:amino acid racemase [Solirubrobacteraceae bacterium]